MDVVVLAKSLTSILSPALPYLWGAGGTVLEGMGNKFGEDIWDRAKTIWAKLRPKITAKPSAQEAAQDLAKTPENEDAQAAFRHQLTKLLSEDEPLAADLAQLVAESSQSKSVSNIQQQAGDQAIQIGTIGQAGKINIQQ